MLERLSIQTVVANNGIEAVEALKINRFDMILMDIQMPDMDGLEATRTIRTIEGNESHTVIIALTANAMQGDRERCIQAGMDDYLSKPIKQNDIDGMVEKWLSVKPAVDNGKADAADAAFKAIIDPKRIEEIKEIGDDGLLKELLNLYLEDLKQFSRDVSLAQDAGNFQRIYESSHKLKGSSANLGVESIRQACIQMEQFAKDRDPAKISVQLTAMQETMEQIRMFITVKFPAQ